MTDIYARQRQLIGTTAEWASNDPIIGDGEIAVERVASGDVLLKVGNGALTFSALPYFTTGGPNESDPHFATEEEMFADDGMSYGPGAGTLVNAGDPVFTGGGTFVVADEAATEFDAETDGGVKLNIAHTEVSPRSFGAAGDGVTDDTAPVQAWAAWLLARTFDTSILGVIDGNFLITQTIDLRGVFRPLQGRGRSTCGFTQATDNIGIIKIGGTQNMAHPRYGWHGSDFFARYANPQPAANTGAIAILCEYFSYSSLERFHVFGGYRGFASLNSPDTNVCFSSTIRDGKINRCSFRYFEISSGILTGNTGNVIGNIYCSGYRADVASATADHCFVLERIAESDIGQLNCEWMTVGRVAILSRTALSITGMHLEGVAARVVGQGLFTFVGAQVTISSLTFKTVNFSGGDPETNAIGSLASSAMFDINEESQGGASKVVITTGRNQNCTAATTNTRVARALDGWSIEGQTLEVMAWEDTDDILLDSNGYPNVDMQNRPSTPHMPILRRWNDLTFQPFVRAKDDGNVAAGAVTWEPLEDLHACYDAATGKFEAPANGEYLLEYSLAAADNNAVEVRLEGTSGSEKTAYRSRQACGAAVASVHYASTSRIVPMLKGEKVHVYASMATTASQFSLLNIRRL